MPALRLWPTSVSKGMGCCTAWMRAGMLGHRFFAQYRTGIMTRSSTNNYTGKTDSGSNAQEIISLFQFYNSSSQAAEWVLFYEPPKTPDAPQLYAIAPTYHSVTD